MDHRHDFRPGPWRKSVRNNRVYRLQVACGLLGSAIPIDKAQTYFFFGGFEIANQKRSAYLHNQKSTANGYMDLFENRSRVDI